MFKNPILKNTLAAVAIAVVGFALLNFTFIFDFLFQSLVMWCIRLFTPLDLMRTYDWFPWMMHSLFVIIIGLISWPVFRSKLAVLYKAIFMTVPVAVVLVTIGISFYRWPMVAYSISGLISLGILYYFYRSRQPWLYYFSVILVSLALLVMGLLGVEI